MKFLCPVRSLKGIRWYEGPNEVTDALLVRYPFLRLAVASLFVISDPWAWSLLNQSPGP